MNAITSIAALLTDAAEELRRANEAAPIRITIEADMLRAIISDAVDNVRRVVIEENYPHGPGYEEISCVGGDYVPAEEVDGLVDKIIGGGFAMNDVDELGELRDILRSYGFVPCDIPACNCGRWHPRYGLKERWDEICDLLDAAGHPLSNENGHIALRALQSFVDERDELRKRVAELESHKTMAEMTDERGEGEHFIDTLRSLVE